PGPGRRASPRRAGDRAPRPRPAGAARVRAAAAQQRARARGRSASSLQELPDGSRREPGRRLAVHPAPLTAERRTAQPQGDEQQPARTLCLPEPAMLGEEAEVARDLLDEEASAVRGAADV